MALLPSNQRDQSMVLLALVAAVAVGAYWYFYYDPRATELSDRTAHVEQMEINNIRAKAEIARGDEEDLKRQAAEYRENLELMRRLVPTENELPDLLEQVSTAARRVGLDISTVEPVPVIVGEEFDTYRYRLSLEGGYHRVGQFLANVGSLTRIVAPVNLQLEASRNQPGSNNSGGPRDQSPGEAAVLTKFELQTFVAKSGFVPDGVQTVQVSDESRSN
jgi:type IV pilus assembly protein PilO